MGLSQESPTPEQELEKPKKKNRRPKKKPHQRLPEPPIAPAPLTVPAVIGGRTMNALVDSGSQADLLSSSLAHLLNLDFRRLLAPVHADLGADSLSTRLSIYAGADITVGDIVQKQRPFFVATLPPGVDAILGVPWIKDSNVAVSADKVFYVPSGPSEDVYDFRNGRFAFQPQANFDALGFTKEPMPEDVMSRFVLAALAVGVDGLDDYVDYEPHNPLLDVQDDDPSLPDLSAEEAAEALSSLVDEFTDVLVTDLPSRLPPNRPVQHSIDLLDEEKKIRPRVLPIPARYIQQFRAQVTKFMETGYWCPKAIDSACSMFSVPKHDPSQGRFVVNLRPRNENTVKRISPIPDMKGICSRVAANKYRTKLDFKMAYEQIRLWADSVAKSGFVTPLGTFVSRVMQQGDCNAPDTMHRVVNMMFSKALGRFVDVFYDDVFVYSQTRRAHLRYLRIVLTTLRHYRFYLSSSKAEFMAPSLKALGCIIDDAGVHVDPEQWDAIRNWPTPDNPKDILRFTGSVQWMADHLPRLNEILAPISRLTGSVTWDWSPACEAAFLLIKSLVPQSLSPLDITKLDSGEEKLFIFSDASMLGCGSWVGQGATRETARPHRYHSAKFNSAQRNYTTTDQELLAVLDACLKFREIITGYDVTIVTDHLPLRTYWERDPKLTRRHNNLADSLSRLAELCAEDKWLKLPLPTAQEPPPAADDAAPFAEEPSARMVLAVMALVAGGQESPAAELLSASRFGSSPLLAPVLTLSSASLPSPLHDALPAALRADPLARKVLADPDATPAFLEQDGALFRRDGDSFLLYLPQGSFEAEAGTTGFREWALRASHDGNGHLGAAKVLSNLRRSFWWASMHKDAIDYVSQCEICARSKAPTAKPYGLLHPLPVPSRPRQVAGLDFVVGLPPVKLNGVVVDATLSVTDFLTKMVVLIPLPSTATAEDVAQLYHDSVFKRFGLQESLVSDRDAKFTSRFWRAYQRLLSVSLRLSSSAHPQTDGRSEVTNKLVGQVLRSLCEDAPETWADKMPLVEYCINANTSSATGLAPFEALYGFLPTSWPNAAWTTPGLDGDVQKRAEQARLDWLRCSDALISSRIDMTYQANRRRRAEPSSFAAGHRVYLSTAGLRFPHSLSGRFVPRFIGPYPILSFDAGKSTAVLDLPSHLRIHNKVHSSKLRPHHPNDDLRFPSRSFSQPPAVLVADGAEEWLVEKIVGDRTRRKKREFRVRYLGYSAAQDEWRPEDELQETAPDALQEYLDAQNTRRASRPRRGVLASLVNNSFFLLSSLASPTVSRLGGG
ncbi:hypothetical protein JCM10213_007402 [Rhodosporidiobolus nylandii]